MPKPTSFEKHVEWKEQIQKQQASGLSVEKMVSAKSNSPSHLPLLEGQTLPEAAAKIKFC